MSEKQLTWIPHIPLIGGFPIGAEIALGTAPEFIASLPGFLGNDKHYINHQNVTLARNIQYIPIDPTDMKFERKINIVVGTPPCAALSQLNTGKNDEVKGSGCATNEFMYTVFEHGMKKFDADVIIVENAPALFTEKGADVAKGLYELCTANGYSMTLYKTTTDQHGIPQRRDRTFAFAWKSECAPVLDWINKPRDTFSDYINSVDESASLQSEIINSQLMEDGYYAFINATLGDPRKIIVKEDCVTCFKYVLKMNLLNEAYEWNMIHGDDRAKRLLSHAKAKHDAGKGAWDGSIHIFDDVMHAVIGRNMNDTIHPTKDRSLTVREAMHMMGLPHNFELMNGRKSLNHIAQNVPTCTAADMVRQAVKFINGELRSSEAKLVKQNNWTRVTEYFDLLPAPSLSEFF